MESQSLATSPLRRVLHDWGLVFPRPGRATFQAATAPMAWSHVFIALALPALATGLVRLLSVPFAGEEPVTAFIGGVVVNVVTFSILAVLLLFVARLVRGHGDAVDHMYALALFWPVLLILLGVPAVAGAIWLPAGLGLFVLLCGTYLTYFAMQVVHNLPDRQARVLAISPLVLGLVCTGCASGIYLLLAAHPELVGNP